MIRNCSLEEISDGRLYGINDMVKAGCGDCRGCSDCCRGMGSSIVLDPYDVHRIRMGLGIKFEQLLNTSVELNVSEGLILPNLKMTGKQEACYYLDEEGRCSIHKFRPGICRLFPLGRYYENDDYKYFLQIHECSMKNRTKVKVSKWIDTPDYRKYRKYILMWHSFVRDFAEQVQKMNPEELHNRNMMILNCLYIQEYPENRFFEEFENRKQKFNKNN